MLEHISTELFNLIEGTFWICLGLVCLMCYYKIYSYETVDILLIFLSKRVLSAYKRKLAGF